VQVLPLGENKTQKVVAGDRTGVVHCFSVKKGEVVTSFKTLPTGQQVRSSRFSRKRSSSSSSSSSRAMMSQAKHLCAATEDVIPLQSAMHSLDNKLSLLLLQITSVTTGRTAKQKDKIFVAAGNMVRDRGQGSSSKAGTRLPAVGPFERSHLLLHFTPVQLTQPGRHLSSIVAGRMSTCGCNPKQAAHKHMPPSWGNAGSRWWCILPPCT
jgi:hypothetical protein